MKTEKQIQEEVWKQCVAYIQGKDYLPGMIETKEIALLAVAKTIELMHKKNTLKDSTATIIQKNGYDEGYATCVREIEERLSKTHLISYDSWKQGYKEGCTDFEASFRLKLEPARTYDDDYGANDIEEILKKTREELTCQKRK